MVDILDPSGRPFERPKTWRGFAVRWSHTLLAWALHTRSGLLTIGICAGAVTSVVVCYGTIRSTLLSVPSLESTYISEIPAAELRDAPGMDASCNPSFRISGLVYHQQLKALDMRVLNHLGGTAGVNRIVFHLRYFAGWGATLPVSGRYEIKISANEIREAKARRVPLEVSRGFNVAHSVANGDLERIVFPLGLSDSDLYIPPPENGGRYILYVCMDVNGSWTTERYDFLALLRGESDAALVGPPGAEQRVQPGSSAGIAGAVEAAEEVRR